MRKEGEGEIAWEGKGEVEEMARRGKKAMGST